MVSSEANDLTVVWAQHRNSISVAGDHGRPQPSHPRVALCTGEAIARAIIDLAKAGERRSPLKRNDGPVATGGSYS